MNKVTISKDLALSKLKNNFAQSMLQFVKKNVPDKALQDLATTQRPTHTFPAERYSLAGPQSVYRDILFRDEALVCARLRKSNSDAVSGIPSRLREIGMDQYVFSYLGVHEHYYGHERSFPFGVFISNTVEEFPYCNATTRDLSSQEAAPNIESNFLRAIDARTLLAYQICNEVRFAGKFWDYWRSPSSIHYPLVSWAWKTELHYFEKLNISSIEAILWPSVQMHAEKGGYKYLFDSGEAQEFARKHASCKVIPYTCRVPSIADDFGKASYAVARYFASEGEYPQHANDAIERIQDEFSTDPHHTE